MMAFIRTLNKLSRHIVKNVAYQSYQMSTSSSKVAVILSGCGVYDGTEVNEASAILVHLSRHGADVSVFAPNINQMHVINHTKGEPAEEERNVLEESARIARGKIAALDTLQTSDFDAVVLPGGFGAAKNLSTFAVDGKNMQVNSDVQRVLSEFKSANKPIGMVCISSVIAAKLFDGCEVTVGSDQEEGGKYPYASTAGAINEMGANHVKKTVTEAHVDQKNKIVTSPAFMCDTHIHEVFDGIGSMVANVLVLAKK